MVESFTYMLMQIAYVHRNHTACIKTEAKTELGYHFDFSFARYFVLSIISIDSEGDFYLEKKIKFEVEFLNGFQR